MYEHKYSLPVFPSQNISFMNIVILEQEFGVNGENLEICYGIHDTIFGNCLIAITERGICNLQFLDQSLNQLNDQFIVSILRKDWRLAKFLADRPETEKICDRLFAHLPKAIEPSQFPVDLCIKGTKFQIEVWRNLLQIPFGETINYQGLARSLGRPTAARAIGNAIGKNPVSYLIPCHRVIRASGALGGYRWGTERKQAMLDWESSLV
jgi:AraC family transcriptional regulator of adaptative response/methylated-DNA-[protein]-cysteine methyltransferase